MGPPAVGKAGGEGLWAGQRPSVSLQQCCDCCGLGLRVRAEGQSCESNPNLGYPCNHVMLSCCEGEDPLIVPEVRRPPEPEAAPRRGACCSPSQAGGRWVAGDSCWGFRTRRCPLAFCGDLGRLPEVCSGQSSPVASDDRLLLFSRRWPHSLFCLTIRSA